tara:strand:+ start:596 stop:721 length:126 start_codon:yes stop_codon:yes gene_type:complete
MKIKNFIVEYSPEVTDSSMCYTPENFGEKNGKKTAEKYSFY